MVPRTFILIPLVVVVAGIVWVLTVGTLLGSFLVVGGVAALGLNALPSAFDWFAKGLSTGFWPRR
jgi:hypothetical protein